MVCFTGIFTGDETQDDSKLFLCERHCFTDLLQGLGTPCSCGLSNKPWIVESLVQVC